MGYDGQFYAQLAVRPDPADPEVQRALDTPAYRARRMLLPWVAHLLGAGRPAWVLQVYALLNVASWLALAALLWRWFPPVGAERTLRWLGVLFSAGLLASVRNALADGPSLLLLAAGMRWLELRRSWLAAATLGLAGLARETSVLAGVAFLDGLRKSWRDWGRTCVQGVLVVLPVALWLFYLRHVLPQEGGAGAGNFALPFSGVCNRAVSLWTVLRGADHVPFYTWYSLALLVSLVVQACFFLLRPRWSDPWWRVGAIHAVLLVFLGDASGRDIRGRPDVCCCRCFWLSTWRSHTGAVGGRCVCWAISRWSRPSIRSAPWAAMTRCVSFPTRSEEGRRCRFRSPGHGFKWSARTGGVRGGAAGRRRFVSRIPMAGLWSRSGVLGSTATRPGRRFYTLARHWSGAASSNGTSGISGPGRCACLPEKAGGGFVRIRRSRMRPRRRTRVHWRFVCTI